MKKKITAMLLAICCISSTWTVYADDFSSGSSEVEIEITEDEDADVIFHYLYKEMELMKCFLTGQKAVLPVGISVQWLIRS